MPKPALQALFKQITLSVRRRACKTAALAGLLLALTLFAPAPGRAEGGGRSSGTQARIVQMLKYVAKDRWTQGRAELSGIKDPLGRKLFQWMHFRGDYDNVGFADVSAFIRANPDWPDQKRLRVSAEKSMDGGMAAADIAVWFDQYPPLTPAGMYKYLGALEQLGRTGDAQAKIREWWKTAGLEPRQQALFLKDYSGQLDKASYVARLDFLLNNRSYTNARSIARVLGKGYPELAEARIALAEGSPGVNGAIAKVPASLHNDSGLLLERLRWRRKNDVNDGAIQILRDPPAKSKITNPEGWWKERSIIIRRLIEEKDFKTAYLLASRHEQLEGVSFAEAEWLAGWLALRFLNEPWKAFNHFETMYNNVTTPLSKSRGAYWAGRASEALKHADVARDWYGEAATYRTTFYGQLAAATLGSGPGLPADAAPDMSSAQKAAFRNGEMAQAAKLMAAAGMRLQASAFIKAIEAKAAQPADFALLSDLAKDIGQPHDAVKVAKDAAQKNIFLIEAGYPVVVGEMRHIDDPEWALIHALIRQESMFDDQAESPVGAKGLMQLMPATAQETARKAGLAHNTSWLTSKPQHNIKLGSRYLAQVVGEFGGSYPLALAAYNAGPSRPRNWIRQFGDPRTADVDMIDWIELIPISETRNYVQRVMESVYVYRILLKDVQKKPAAPLHVAFYEIPPLQQ